MDGKLYSLEKFELNIKDESVYNELHSLRVPANSSGPLIKKTVQCIDYSDLSAKSIEDGKIDVQIFGTTFNCFFKDSKSDYLYVMIRGFRAKHTSAVAFDRWSWYNITSGKLLAVNNPMFLEYDNLASGYYLGTRDKDYTYYLSKIVLKFAEIYNIPTNHIIFYGSSAAGTVAVHACSLIKDSNAIAINMQFLPDTIKGLKIDYENNTKTKFSDLGNRVNTKFAISQISGNIIFVANMNSKRDLEPVLDYSDREGVNLKYGLTLQKNHAYWIYEAWSVKGTAHDALDSRTTFLALDYLIKNMICEKPVPAEIYTLLSECWSERYELISNQTIEKIDSLIAQKNEDSLAQAYSMCTRVEDHPDINLRLVWLYCNYGKMRNYDKAIDLLKSNSKYYPDYLEKIEKIQKMKLDYNIHMMGEDAILGNFYAMYYLSKKYEAGNDVDKDLDKAINWMRKAAKIKSFANNDLYDLLLKRGNPEDLEESFCVINNAVKDRNIPAMVRLSRSFCKGVGTKKDLDQAVYWIRYAASLADWPKSELCDVLNMRGTPEDMEELNRLRKDM